MGEVFTKRERGLGRRFDLLSALIVLSSDNNYVAPTNPRHTLSEVVSGFLAFGGREGDKVTYRNHGGEGFEKHLESYFRREARYVNGEIDPITKRAIRRLIKMDYSHAGRPSCEIYDHFRKNEILFGENPTPKHEISRELVGVVIRGIIPFLPPDQKKSVEGIAAAMRPYVEADLASIEYYEV